MPSAPRDDVRFRESYDAYYGVVLRLLRRLGVNSGDLEDVCHEVFLVFMKRLPEIHDRGRDRAYLFGVAYRVAADFRRLKRHTDRPLDDGRAEPGGNDPAQLYELRSELAHVLASLPDERRSVLVFHELEGLAIPEIAEIVDAPVNTVYSRLRLARVDFERATARLAEARR